MSNMHDIPLILVGHIPTAKLPKDSKTPKPQKKEGKDKEAGKGRVSR